RRVVLVRCSKHRQGKIEHRLEVLGGYLIAYLNLDKVIKIIRTEDEPKPVLIKTFKLTDVQAEAILNMRLRNLRRLEEMEIRQEDKDLRVEKKSLEDLLRSETAQWKKIAEENRDGRTPFGHTPPRGGHARPGPSPREAPPKSRGPARPRRGSSRGALDGPCANRGGGVGE